MKKIMKISTLTNFLCRIQFSHLKFSIKVPFRSIWNVNRTFLAVKLLLYLRLVTMETHIHMIFVKNGHKCEKVILGS